MTDLADQLRSIDPVALSIHKLHDLGYEDIESDVPAGIDLLCKWDKYIVLVVVCRRAQRFVKVYDTLCNRGIAEAVLRVPNTVVLIHAWTHGEDGLWHCKPTVLEPKDFS